MYRVNILYSLSQIDLYGFYQIRGENSETVAVRRLSFIYIIMYMYLCCVDLFVKIN